MFRGFGKKSVQDLGRKRKKKNEKKRNKREKKERNLIAAKSGVGRMKEHLKRNIFCEIFFTVFQPFLNETAFYTELSWRFSGVKTEVT